MNARALAGTSAVGSNVVSRLIWSTAVHWLVDGQAKPITSFCSVCSMSVRGVPAFPVLGSKVTRLTFPATAVHSVGDGQTTTVSGDALTLLFLRAAFVVGSKVISTPSL